MVLCAGESAERERERLRSEVNIAKWSEMKMGSQCTLHVSMHMFWVKIVSLWSKIYVCTLWILTVYEICHFMNSLYLTHTHEIGIGIVIVICIVCNKEKRKCRKITKFLGFPKRYPDSIWVIKERICGIQLLLIFLYLLLPGITIKLLKTQSHIVEESQLTLLVLGAKAYGV